MAIEETRTAEKKLRFKVLSPHVPGCSALKHTKAGQWGTPWAFLREQERRDKIGRRNDKGGSRWWLVGCNDIGCTALITVDETSILEALPHE